MKVTQFVAIVILLFPLEVFGSDPQLYTELNLVGGYSESDKWIGKNGGLQKNSVGLEYFQKFSDDYGDYLTTNLQLRLSYDSLESFSDAWAIEVHNAWVEYKLGLGKKLTLGHFDPVFGLEPLLDTHGALLQTLALKSIGYKKDWGLGYSGILGSYDFSAAIQNGSGMALERKDSSFLATCRIGTPSNRDFQYGVSALAGRVLRFDKAQTFPRPDLVQNTARDKLRLGIDAQYPLGALYTKGEVSVGRDSSRNVGGALLELNREVPSLRRLEIQLQTQYWSNDFDDSASAEFSLGLGAVYKISSTWTFRLLGLSFLEKGNSSEDWRVVAQLYFFS
jgi:hypothetical protein